MESEQLAIPGNPGLGRSGAQIVDSPTIIGVTLVVYTCSSILHEAVGHGLTCVLLGGKVACIASTVCISGGEPISESASRLVAAAGTLMNLIAAGFFWAVLHQLNFGMPLWRYFVWLSMAVNGFIGAGYMAVPTLIGFGDWMDVLKGLHPYWFLRVAIVLLGTMLYVAVYWLAAKELQRFLGRDSSAKRSRALKLTLVPYLAGGLAFCIAGSFNPVGMKLVLSSAAAASFGGTAGLAWLMPWVCAMRDSGQPPRFAVEMKRNWGWTAGGVASGVVLIFLLGQGVKFGS
jgi:hypothetical protein